MCMFSFRILFVTLYFHSSFIAVVEFLVYLHIRSSYVSLNFSFGLEFKHCGTRVSVLGCPRALYKSFFLFLFFFTETVCM